jgi:FHA domain
MASQGVANDWSLEVVRGRDAGRRYAIGGGVTVLGAGLGGVAGIDLADQEGAAPRKMAARQASIESAGSTVVLRDLDSPGGTFVNRQRVLSGQSRPLALGDLIQVGGVQLKLVPATTPAQPANEARPQPAAARPEPFAARPQAMAAAVAAPNAPFVFNMKCGSVCRSWDDFLTISAQRWGDIRDELTSGRLAAFLVSAGQAALAPEPHAPGSPDERLDAWLGRIPVSRPAKPELDVHPRSLVVRAKGGGGTTTSKIRIVNTGYRLLKSSVRVEPPSVPWLKLGKDVDGRSIMTVEGTDLPLEIIIPDNLSKPLAATLVIDSNGGAARVNVSLEAATTAATPTASPHARSLVDATWNWDWKAVIARQSMPARFIGWSVATASMRLLVALASGAAAMAGIGGGGNTVGLAGPALALAAVGAVLGARFAIARNEMRDVGFAAFASACAGVFVAAIVVACCQAIETSIPALNTSPAVVKIVVWGVLGSLAALLSLLVAPPVVSPSSEVTR